MEKSHPSIFRMIQIDYASFLAVMFLVVFLGLGLNDAFSGKTFVLEDNYLVLISAFLSPVILIWRYSRIGSLYTMGIETEAIVNAVGFFRGRGKVKYIYTYGGQKYISSITVMKTKRTEIFRVGDQISVLIDPDKPKRSVIANVFN